MDDNKTTVPVTDLNQSSPNPTPPVADITPAPQLGTVDEQHPEDLEQRWTTWRCMVCDYVYEGQKPLMKCPRCGNEDPDKFD